MEGRHPQHLIDRIANINGVLTGFVLWPQAVKAFVADDTAVLSVPTFAALLVNSTVWQLYAHHRRLWPLRISSAMNIAAAIIIMTVALTG